MKAKIHPQFYNDTVVTCNCGNTFKTGSTKKEIKVEICSKCHPFYTNKHKYIDMQGRVTLFQKKQAIAKKMQLLNKTKKKSKRTTNNKTTKSLRELLGEV